MLFFSHGTVNLAMVIPAMDYINEVFTTGMLAEEAFNPAICAAVGLAKKTLNKYYSLTDLSRVYCMAISKYFPATQDEGSDNTDTPFQFCIPGTSWIISSTQNGQQTGLILHIPLFITYMTPILLFVLAMTWDPPPTAMWLKSM
jgi:hypothetical protein